MDELSNGKLPRKQVFGYLMGMIPLTLYAGFFSLVYAKFFLHDLEMEQGYLVYELKVPLTAAENSQAIGICFETGKIEKPAGKNSFGSGRGGKGGGGGGGGKKMGGKGKRNSHGGGSPEPIEMWAKVHLAERPPG